MSKTVRLWLIIIMYIPVLQHSRAQMSDSVLTEISRKLAVYTAAVPREEIFIHSDKEEYIAGEDMWMKLFVTDRQTNRLSDKSKVVYLEILDSESAPVIQKRFLIADGTGPGHLVLPDTMRTGIYTLRAYTNMMKNFLPYNCYVKEIAVFNTLRRNAEDIPVRRRKSIPTVKRNPENAGIRISVEHSRDDSLEIIVEDRYQQIDDGNGACYIIIQSRGNIKYSSGLQCKENIARILVPGALTEGINQVVIFNSRAVPVAEKLFYSPVRRNKIIDIKSASSYGTRDRISLGLEAADSTVKLKDMSISVAPISWSVKTPDIESYLVFGSEYNSASGFISENILAEMTPEEADSILSGLSSNWISWPVILEARFPQVKYPVEDEYHYLNGSVSDGNGDTILMFSPGRYNSFRYSVCDSTGNFTLKLHIDEEQKDLVIMPARTDGSRKIALSSPFAGNYPEYGTDFFFTEQLSPQHFSRSGTDFQVRKLFKTQVSEIPSRALYEPLRPVSFYGIPDMEINLSDYVELPTMEEIFLEVIPDVALRKRTDGYEIVISQRINDRRFVMDPAIMIDGVLIKEASVIAELDPGNVEKIHIISKKYLAGGYLFDGIVNVITKSADFSIIPLPEYMTRIKYQVAAPVPEFHSPVYSAGEMKKDRTPDYRNVIYWNPSVSVENPVEFRSADNKTDYIIKVQGMTTDGRAFCEMKKISVE